MADHAIVLVDARRGLRRPSGILYRLPAGIRHILAVNKIDLVGHGRVFEEIARLPEAVAGLNFVTVMPIPSQRYSGTSPAARAQLV